MAIKVFVNIFVCIMDLIKEELLFRDIFSYRFQKSKYKAVISAILILLGVGICSASEFEKYVSMIYIPIIFGILFWRLEEKEKRSFVYFVVSYVCVCQIDFLIAALIKLFMPIKVDAECICFATAVISTLIVGTVCMVCRYFRLHIINRKMNIFMPIQFIILFLNVILQGAVSNVLENNDDIFYGKLALLSAAILSGVMILLGFVAYSLVQSNKNYRELDTVHRKYLEMQNEYYARIQQQSNEMKKFRHDMQGHFICLTHFLQKEEPEKALEYIEEMKWDLAQTKMKYDVGNDIANIILNDKVQTFEKYSIKVNVKGTLPVHMKITNYDFCSLFSNLINNAVEACQKVENSERAVNIKLGYFEKYISLYMENTCIEDVSLKTTKVDRENHGFGIAKIKDCVERYGGDMKIEPDKGIFIVDIILKYL